MENASITTNLYPALPTSTSSHLKYLYHWPNSGRNQVPLVGGTVGSTSSYPVVPHSVLLVPGYGAGEVLESIELFQMKWAGECNLCAFERRRNVPSGSGRCFVCPVIGSAPSSGWRTRAEDGAIVLCFGA